MRTLLEHHAFDVHSDEGLPAIGARVSSQVARATKLMKHLRIVIADRHRDA
jgi:hypothetical protein